MIPVAAAVAASLAILGAVFWWAARGAAKGEHVRRERRAAAKVLAAGMSSPLINAGVDDAGGAGGLCDAGGDGGGCD